MFFARQLGHPLGDGVRLHRGEHQVAGVQNENGAGAAAFGHIDDFFLHSRLFLEFAYRGGAGIDDRQNAADHDRIAKAYM